MATRRSKGNVVDQQEPRKWFRMDAPSGIAPRRTNIRLIDPTRHAHLHAIHAFAHCEL
jgi:hypothetical protein